MKDPLELLRETVHVLLIDDDPDVLALLAEGFGHCPLIKVHKARTNTDARDLLESGNRCHAIFTDLGILDWDGDEFAVIRAYAEIVPTYCITGRQEPKAAFEASRLGARRLFVKPVEFRSAEIAEAFESAFYWCLANRVVANDKSELVGRAIALLISREMDSVTMWANELGVSEGYFRDAWSATCSVRLKHVLYLKNLYYQAFAYCRSAHIPGDAEVAERRTSAWLADILRYYHSNKDALSRVIRRTAAVRPRHLRVANAIAEAAGYAVKHSEE